MNFYYLIIVTLAAHNIEHFLTYGSSFEIDSFKGSIRYSFNYFTLKHPIVRSASPLTNGVPFNLIKFL